jgi:hypothetical protein
MFEFEKGKKSYQYMKENERRKEKKRKGRKKWEKIMNE